MVPDKLVIRRRDTKKHSNLNLLWPRLDQCFPINYGFVFKGITFSNGILDKNCESQRRSLDKGV